MMRRSSDEPGESDSPLLPLSPTPPLPLLPLLLLLVEWQPVIMLLPLRLLR